MKKFELKDTIGLKDKTYDILTRRKGVPKESNEEYIKTLYNMAESAIEDCEKDGDVCMIPMKRFRNLLRRSVIAERAILWYDAWGMYQSMYFLDKQNALGDPTLLSDCAAFVISVQAFLLDVIKFYEDLRREDTERKVTSCPQKS